MDSGLNLSPLQEAGKLLLLCFYCSGLETGDLEVSRQQRTEGSALLLLPLGSPSVIQGARLLSPLES